MAQHQPRRTRKRNPAVSRPESGPGGIAGERRLLVLVSAALALATLAVYLRSLGHDFVNMDDVEYVANNPPVLAGLTLKSFLWAFTTFHSANWHPLTWLSHMLDVQVFQLWPGGHHLTSILLHVANSLLLLTVLRLLTGSLWKSAFVAALFALHPQHVESVAWVSERKDVLSAFFMMLAMLAYWWYVRKPSIGRYVLITLAFALGLMAKPMLVSLPVLLLLLDFWPLARLSRPFTRQAVRLVMEKIPLFAMSLASCLVTVKAQAAVGAITTFETTPLHERISNAVVSTVTYLFKTLWPTRLGSYYPLPAGGWPATEVIGAAVLLAAITCLSVRTAWSRPYIAWGWLWYLITLAPVMGIIQVGQQARADRYTYIPLIGVFVIIAYAVPELVARLDAGTRKWQALGVAAVLVVAAMGVATYVQVGYWRSGITLARRAIAVTENNWYSHGSLGNALQNVAEQLDAQGKRAEAVQTARQAAGELRIALSIAPHCADAHERLGRALMVIGDCQAAITEYRKAVRDNPNNPQAHNDLAMALQSGGTLGQAIDEFREAVRLNPHYVEALGNLSVAYYRNGDYAQAWKLLRRCEEAGGRAKQSYVRQLSAKMPQPDP